MDGGNISKALGFCDSGDSYTFSCSLYFPKHVFKAEPSKIKIECWLDMVHDDICIGTTDGTYYLNLIHEGDETFCMAYDAQTGKLCPPRERAVPYECSDEGNYYKLKIENLPYLPLMHKEDSSALTAIDTERGGDVVVNMKISGIGQNLSSFVYLDDIALKDNGRQSFLLTVLWKACMDIITFTDMNHLTASGRKKAFRR